MSDSSFPLVKTAKPGCRFERPDVLIHHRTQSGPLNEQADLPETDCHQNYSRLKNRFAGRFIWYTCGVDAANRSTGQDDSETRSRASTPAFVEVYEELRRIARAKLKGERPGHTLQTTALVHEAFLKLRSSRAIADRKHFLHLAAEAMRQILVDHARAKQCLKRGSGTIRRQELSDVAVFAVDPDVDTILTLEEAICRLEIASPSAAEVIKLRFFAGLSAQETAEATGLSESTVHRHWRFARAWLFNALGNQNSAGSNENESAAATKAQPAGEDTTDL